MVMSIPAGGVRLPGRFHLFSDAVRAAWQDHLRRRAQQAALRHLSRLGPRLIADTGVDPKLVRSAADGWSDLLPNGYLVHRRR